MTLKQFEQYMNIIKAHWSIAEETKCNREFLRSCVIVELKKVYPIVDRDFLLLKYSEYLT